MSVMVCRCPKCGVFLSGAHSYDRHVKIPHIFGADGRRYAPATNRPPPLSTGSTAQSNEMSDLPVVVKTEIKSEHFDDCPTISSLPETIVQKMPPPPIIDQQSQSQQESPLNDTQQRSSSSTSSVRQDSLSPQEIDSNFGSFAEIIKHTNRDNECVFYDYNSVSCN